MHFYKPNREQKKLANSVTKFCNLGCCYEFVGGTTIQQHTFRNSTKQNMKLQHLMSRRHQNIWSRNLGQKCKKILPCFFYKLWFLKSILWVSLWHCRWEGYVGHIWGIWCIRIHCVNFRHVHCR